MKKRPFKTKLELNRETLYMMNSKELEQIAGANQIQSTNIDTCPTEKPNSRCLCT